MFLADASSPFGRYMCITTCRYRDEPPAMGPEEAEREVTGPEWDADTIFSSYGISIREQGIPAHLTTAQALEFLGVRPVSAG